MKERAVLALLLMSPGQQRRRLWLQEMLWGNSPVEAGQTSLRRALSNIRRDLGPLSASFKSNRNAVWLEPEFFVSPNENLPAAEFLADMDIPNEDFEDWLRDRRQTLPETTALRAGPSPPRQDADIPTISITAVDTTSETRQYLCRMMAQQLAASISGIGQCRILLSDRPETRQADFTFSIEVRSEGTEWQIMLRLLGNPTDIYLWSGRERMQRSISQIWDSLELIRLVNKAHAALSDQFMLRGPKGDIARIQRAIRRIYNYDKPGLATAINLLRVSANGENVGLSLAWLSFAQLTSVLEFRESGNRNVEEAIELARDAVRLLPRNPTILGLAAQVQLKFTKDFDYGHHLSLRAVEAGESNPFALDALSQSQLLRGERALSHRTAGQARTMATGLANSFSWDMQAALSALGLGELPEAEELARICHQKMPSYRPAIRYLIALSLLNGKAAEARKYAERLARIEPGFTLPSLLDQGYPVEKLRNLGLLADLRDRIGGPPS